MRELLPATFSRSQQIRIRIELLAIPLHSAEVDNSYFFSSRATLLAFGGERTTWERPSVALDSRVFSQMGSLLLTTLGISASTPGSSCRHCRPRETQIDCADFVCCRRSIGSGTAHAQSDIAAEDPMLSGGRKSSSRPSRGRSAWPTRLVFGSARSIYFYGRNLFTFRQHSSVSSVFESLTLEEAKRRVASSRRAPVSADRPARAATPSGTASIPPLEPSVRALGIEALLLKRHQLAQTSRFSLEIN